MAPEARFSLEWAIRNLAGAGRNAMLGDGPLQRASSRDTRPEITSMIPELALGAMERDRVGLRRSQSTRMTRAPTCAMLCAKAAAMVDLPSLGMAEVRPTTLVVAAAPFKSAASLIVRIASAKRENGCSTTLDATPASAGSGRALGLGMLSARMFLGRFWNGIRAIHGSSRSDST